MAAVLAVLLPGTPAWAHAQLVSADPAKDAALAKAPAAVTLTFSERLNPDFTTIVISDAAKQRVPASTPTIDAVAGSVKLAQPLPNGAYLVAYRVVSVDGHTVQGSYAFTVNDPVQPAAPPPPASAVAVADAAPPATSDGIPTGVLIGLGAAGVLLAVVAAYLFLSARRRTTGQPR
ncbi:copper resistance CopC family protein [Micromonosporaceae bacterium Da 78-11]